MKLTHYIYISAALAMLSSCGEDIEPVYTVGEADNAIVLQAGVADGMQKMQTRGGTRAAGAPTYVAFAKDTKMTLRIDGTWLEHKNAGGTLDTSISQSTTGTIKEVATSDKDLDGTNDGNEDKDTRGVALDPQLYWDDYGTADPKNIDINNGGKATNGTGGRQKGLTIYGVAVNDASASAPNPGSNWTNLSWTLDKDQSNGWSTKDLLTSNNIKDDVDGTYKFGTKNTGNLLKFTHAMSKITVNLTANAGFPSKFEHEVIVKLNGFYLSGNVNIEGKSSTPTSTTSNAIIPYLEKGEVGVNQTLTYSALVFPGKDISDEDEEILEITADGNNYYVKAKNLKTAMTAHSTPQTALQQGYNYLLNITVNKTDVDVEATIVAWKDIQASDVPLIKVNETYGHNNGDFPKESFDLFRSTTITGSYLVQDNYAKVTKAGNPATYTLAPAMYWPNHSTHYFFRGVWPLRDLSNTSINYAYIPSKDFNDASNSTSISVQNVPYKSGTFPSDLMIGRPLKDDDSTPDETCKIATHVKDDTNPNGICATEGKIRLNFHYMMSQVKVILKTPLEEDAKNKVTFDEYTKVEIVGGYSSGVILLGSCLSDFTGKQTENYNLTKVADSHTNFHNAIIPQSLVDSEGNPVLKFKITLKNAGSSTTDEYETLLGISQIPTDINDPGNIPTSGGLIDAWEPGKIYTYTLTLTKTEIKVEATITDWYNVNGSADVWL